jgi:hypothetical protein
VGWWTPSSANLTGTVIRCKTTGYPTGPTDGTLVADVAGGPNWYQSFDHTNLPVGLTYYYAAYAYFADAGRYYSGPANATGVCSGPDDFDRDGDVDLGDFSLFQLCFNGPNRPRSSLEGCDKPDIDADGDVDLTDFATFQGCFNGPNRLPTLNCVS